MAESRMPGDCSLLVAITFHFVPQRVVYLLDVVRALADFAVRRIDIRVMINDVPDDALGKLREILAGTLPRHASVTFQRCRDLAHPFELAWAHKPLIQDVFLRPESPYTHFVYLEDDMRFGFANFRYFLEARPALAGFGLIPSFVRVEYSIEGQEMRCTDVQRAMPFEQLRTIELGPYLFVTHRNPYCAIYVLDHGLAAEYVGTASFGLATSAEVRSVGTRERSAMGLCWENVPPGFRSRYAIPIDPARMTAAAECWVPHLPNNYSDRARSASGKLAMRNLVVPASGTAVMASRANA
ncbi:hypothetical protein GXW78_19300 [Roseomonas terrae]|uniref:Glycosyltransferase family 2 protein n=1 Tax=Neoroseomonas terrae TaxID=424799 RepID=A0ABS5ELB3_9PROT|nr:hypothetical protein [Neoroseomonas terrae]MBR0651825.1 hypothetical protein [Neoroseomonas terrae]